MRNGPELRATLLLAGNIIAVLDVALLMETDSKHWGWLALACLCLFDLVFIALEAG